MAIFMTNKIFLESIYKIDIDFSEIYIIDEKTKNFNKKVLLNTSSRVFDGKQYDDLYIIEPRVGYLIPLPDKYKNNATYLLKNCIGEIGILLQLLDNYIFLYSTNENLIFLNKGINICNLFNMKEAHNDNFI